jgi:hypothetical protein
LLNTVSFIVNKKEKRRKDLYLLLLLVIALFKVAKAKFNMMIVFEAIFDENATLKN